MKKVSGSLKLDLAQYHELLSFTQFGSDLDAVTKASIDHGARLTELLKQGQYSPLTMAYQVLSLFAAKNGYLKRIEVENIRVFEEQMHKFFRTEKKELVDELEKTGVLSDELSERIEVAMQECLEQYQLIYGE